jgi:hypothetical protein
MPSPKTLDIDPEVEALLAKAEKKRTEHKLMLGELVIETGIHKLLNADQLKDGLLQLARQAKAGRPAEEDRRAGAAGTFPEGGAATGKANGGHAEPVPPGGRDRDLLAGTAPQ